MSAVPYKVKVCTSLSDVVSALIFNFHIDRLVINPLFSFILILRTNKPWYMYKFL